MTALAAFLIVCLTGGLDRGPAPGIGHDAAVDLAALGELIVGTWGAADSRHVHEWGVGRRLIRSRSYTPGEEPGEWTLVSEGLWYRDQDEGVLRGLHFAVGMPMHRMEYRTVVDGNRVVHELTTYGESPGRYRETWTFEGERYEWRLERPTGAGLETVMGGTYRRVEPPAGP